MRLAGMHHVRWILAALLISAPGSARPQANEKVHGERRAVLAGKVLDEARDAPIAGVTIDIAGSAATVVTNAHGEFILSLAERALVTLTLRHIGYRALTQLVDVRAADTTRLSFFLTPSVTALETVNVVAESVSQSPRLSGFERRRQQHIGGEFITRAQIERRNAIATSQLLFNVLGIRVIDSAGVKLFASARGHKVVAGPAANIAPCVMAVGVDGQIKEWGYPVDEIVPNEIYGIEVYSGPSTMPREFATLVRDNYCGIVMIWTRADR